MKRSSTAYTRRIDHYTTDGLTGVSNSLAYRVHEIEKHAHSREIWLGVHSSVVAGVNEGEALSQTAFQSTSGAAGVFGAWAPILGTGDTPYLTNYQKYDPHRLIIPDVGATASLAPHLIEIGWGASGAAAESAGDITVIWAVPQKGGRASPVCFQSPRIAAGTKLFLRHLVVGVASATMDFYLGLHEYIG
jgi:hypothetical protein